jgi:hypothetical protein
MDEEHERLKERARASRARALEVSARADRTVAASRAAREAREADPFRPDWPAFEAADEPDDEPPAAPKPQSPPAMSEAQSAGWNSWAMQVIEHAWRSHYQDAVAQFTAEFVRKKIDVLAQALGEECGTNERQLRIEIGRISSEIAALRADLTIMRSVKTGDVVDLPDWRRTDVA